MGPALYAFNDADFTEEDWEGIQRAGRSIKHDDPTKVGRFGIGFNSVYHVTDLPCVFSSKHLAIFDPQKLMFDDEREGYRWSLDDEEDRKDIVKLKDQFKPFQDIVNLVCNGSCTWDKIINEHYFKGTLFRFPLRDEASEISDNLYDSKKATQLFDSFIPDADISVLFLRSVSSISLLHIDSNGSVTIRMKVSTSSPTSPLQQTDDFRGNYVQGKTSFKTVSCSSPGQDETTTKWLVTACRLAEGHVPDIDKLADKLSFYPQVDVAFQCDEDGAGSSGRLSCFLPLPNNETNRTGLPIHINACFGLTDNRRYIKWQEEDQKNDESAEWNELLMKEVLPHVYLKILQDIVKLSKKSVLPVSAVYKLWPNLKETQHSPRWHKVAVDLFQRLFKGQEIFSLAKNENKWVAASDAVFPADTDTDIMSAVFHLLIEEGENLVTVPEHVLLSIKETFPNPDSLEWVTPSFVRCVLHRNNIKSVDKDEKLSILEYVLSDGRYEELNGLQLLPLSDGSFRSFTNQEEDTVLIDNEKFSRVLLPFCKDRFLPEDLNSSTVHHLRHIAMTNSKLYQLINLDANNVAVFCKKHLPKEWKETKGHVKWISMKDDYPPKIWLKEFWKFLNDHWAELRDFIGMPLIPLEPFQQTTSTVMLARLEEKSTLIFQSSREYTLSDQIQKVVKGIGGTVIKKDECLKHHDIESYVLTPSPRNVLQILLNIDRDKVIRGIASTSIHEKEEFKTYISSLDLLSDVEQNLLSALPIFRLMSEKYVAIESKQAVILKSNPAIPKDLPVPDTIIQCANEADRRLLSLLKVELLDPAQLAIYLVDCIDANLFAKENERQIMTWILNHGQILFSQNEELLRKCKNLRFILTEQGERKRPSSVFDPTNKTFLDLFEEDFFPPQVYRSAKMLESLKQLGLQTKEEELLPANILYVASQIQKLHIHSRNRAFKKADVLIRILNGNDLLLKFSEEERQELLQLQWIPCENPNLVKSKNSQKRCLYKPTEIRASKYSAIVGYVMPLASDLNESICHKLDLYSFPPAEKVMENLSVLKSWAQTMPSPDSDYEFKNNLHSTYKFMQENIEQFRKEMNNKSISWLWTQNEFVSPREVVLTYPAELDLSLYIKKVPEEFLQYVALLREFGVKETLADEEIEAILSDIKENIDDRIPPYGEPSELKMSIAILDWMRKNEKNLKDTTPVPVMAQNQNFTLQPLKTTVFCDISDDGLNDLKQDEEEFYVIHEEVLPVTAKWLKIPFLSTRILKPQIIVDEEEYEGIEQCMKTGTLQFTNKLVNPHGKVACLYEPEEGRFLDGTKNNYFTPERIQRLSGLGMLNDVLPLDEVIERANKISQVWAKDKSKAYTHLRCLFHSMEKFAHLDSLHWETLKHISFLPALGTNRHNEVMSVLRKPSEIYDDQCHQLVNMTEFTVDRLNLFLRPDDPVLAKLGVMKTPRIELVLRQLKEAHHRVKSFENSELFKIAISCYDYLNKYLLNDGVPTVIIEYAQSNPFVLIDGCFVNVQSVAMGGTFEEKPYLYFLPTILSKFEKLWKGVGIKSQFTTEQFVAVLQKMSINSRQLKERDLHVCLDILIKGLYGSREESVEDCLIPDEKGVLTKSSKLKFNDSPWMPVQAGVAFCHKLIPRDVACYFNVETTIHNTLKNHLVNEFSPLAKEFGQHEKLTVRIKNIIEAYPAKKDILKELLQNADDAEATEIHFVWDKRKHGTKKLFGEKWEMLQGPALCVYNNKIFSNEDLIGIQQLGEGGKHGTLGRTGKYGLGFNSVYQLTDCPCILTGDEYLCISDPNLKYVETGTRESPGCMYLMDENFKMSFRDVYNTFLPENFPLQSGTMFRLPLRTEAMAEQSEISINAVRDYEMMELFKALQTDPEELILFLKHITKIHFHEINKDGSKSNYFLIEKKVTEDTMKQKEGFHNHVRNSLKSGSVNPHQAIYKVSITSGKKQSQWIIAEQYGWFLPNKEEDKAHAKIPQAGLAACLGTKPKEIEFHGRAFCSLPLPGETGLPVHVNGNFEVDHSRRDLWKEDGESLKTKWNQLLQLNTIAHLYADLLAKICTSFRKGEPKMLVHLKSHLNFILSYFPIVSKTVAPVWHEMINEIYQSINRRNLPVIPILRSVAEQKSSQHSDPKYTFNWSSVSKPDPTESPHFTNHSHADILHILERTEMNLVPFSVEILNIMKSFKAAGVEVAVVSPSSVISYLKQKRMNDPSHTADDLPLRINLTLIKDSKSCSRLLDFCLSNDELSGSVTRDVYKESSSVELNGLPLLLTQDQMLRKFSSHSPKLISKFAYIFQEHKSEFADDQVNYWHKSILLKGKYLEKLTIPVAASFIKPVLQKQLQHLPLNETNELHTAGKEMKEWLKNLWNFFENEVNEFPGGETNGVFSEIKKHFSCSPILPVIYPGQKDTCFLQKIANLHRIVRDPKDHISAILIKLGCMTIDRSFFLRLGEFFHKYIQPELLNIEDKSAVLKQLETIPHSQFDLLSGDESDELQRFLQLGISSSKNIDEYQRMFKSLPLFQTICGKRQRIDFHRNVFILKSVFEQKFPGLYKFDDSNCIFLKNNLVNESLSKCLDIKILGDLDYCVKFIIPSVHKLKQTQLIDLIRLLLELSQTPGYNDSRDTIACALRDVRFIEDVNGDLQMASYFFDDTVELYKVMLSKEKFVPKTFWKLFEYSTRAKSLLKSLGLKHEVSEEEVIEFAHQIESDARGHIELQVLAKKSVTLLKTALFLGAKKSSKLMQTIKTIKFILAVQIDPILCNYHKAFAQERDVVAIKGSLLEKQLDQQNLIWTSMPILPTKSLSTKELDTLRTAGALDEPPSEQVMQNLKNICGSECRTEQLIETRATVFKKSYAYLQSVPFNEALLADLPLVLVENDTSLVKASQANRLENSLKKKLKLLVKLHQCHLTDDPYEHQKLLQLLPKQSQPKLLSGVISVNLVGGQVEHCDYGSSCEFSGWFQKHLSSREFLHGLMCLIREQSKGTISQTEAAHMCESTFGKIQIVCCQALHTELLLNHQPLEGTAMETQVYVKKQEDECVFYLKHNDNMALKVVNEVNMYLTKEINALLENILNSLCLSVLGQLLLCENMEDVERALEQHGVRNTVSDEKGLGFRPNPGTPIQEEWHDSLDMDPLNSFEKGEYVGFCKDELENEYVFAIVVECLDKHSGDTRQNPSRYRIQIGDEKFIDVSSLDLYQFKREKRSAPDGNATCTDIFELLSQTKPSESKPSQSKSSQFEPFPKKSLPQTLEEAKIEIDQSLEQIWKMSDEDKSKAIRRLYLRWHPDKNPDNMELSTEAFKYLMNRIDELQQGKSKRNTSTQSNTTHSYNFRDFYEKWNYEAKSHKRGRERFYQNNFRQQYNFWSHFHETPKPNKEEAKRWYKQAECDLNAAQNDTGCNVYPEWCLFKVHQAVEKALIATEFRRNGQHPGTASTITCLAQKISKYATYLYDLPNTVIHLRALGVDAKRTQYPNFYPPPHIPNDRFKAAEAQEAVNIATKLLRKLEIYITE
ncbi:sacsin [Silurus meridionalis]|nr:sacsin [Silurus meridionalis]